MTDTADRIAYSQMAALVAARPGDPSHKALSAALLYGINTAERAMRDKIAVLRSALGDAEAYPGATRPHADTSRIQHGAADLDRASTARGLQSATAAALLTEAEPHQLTDIPASGK